MQICKYGQEAIAFEKLLLKGVTLFPIQFSKEKMPKTADGWLFKIIAENTLEFFFIGEAWTKEMMIYHCQNYSFCIIEDY